jgi:putative spermidine/putrescine transport system permease protein
MNEQKNKKLSPAVKQSKALNFTGLGLFFILAIFPIVFSIGFALIYSLGLFGYFGTGFTLEYFARIFEASEILPAFTLSSYISATSTVLTVGLGLFLSIYLGTEIKRGRLSLAIYIPLIMPSAVAALFIYLLLSDSGLLARSLSIMGAPSLPPMVNDPFAIGIIVTHVGLGVPFFALLFAQISEKSRLNEVKNLCYSLGANSLDATFKIIVPILLYRARPQILLSFILVFGSFEIPAILGQHNPEMISVLAVRKLGLFDIGQKPEAFVVAFIYSIVVVGLLLLFYKRKEKNAN